jgi:hypothetical protein
MVHPERFPFYPEHVPEELKLGRFWVCCDAEKVPLVPWENNGASSTDPATWRHFDEALAAFDAYPARYAGLGRVITDEDDYVGVDFDDVRDKKTRELSPIAMEALGELDSYTEVSPSGTGVKVWIKGDLERSHVKEGLEVYARGRYFTTTGEFLPQFSLEIRDRTSEIRALVEREFPAVAPGGAGDREPYDGPQLALVEFFDGVDVLEEVSDGMGAKFRIRCPWVSQHTHAPETGAYVGQMENGALWFNCWHAHCAHRGWTEFRQATRLRVKKLRLIKEGRYV